MKRNSNIELLRIIAMFMIVISHYTVHSGIQYSTLPLGFNRFFMELSTLGNIGVVIFILITGYYSFNKTNSLNIKKIVLLILQTLFYSISIFLIFLLTTDRSIGIKDLIYSFLPITSKAYWFMTAYIVLYLFIPFINVVINNTTQKQLKTMIIYLCVVHYTS